MDHLAGADPEEVWNELLLELKAASEELYVAFVSLSASPQGNEPAAKMRETQRYDEALRRFANANAAAIEIQLEGIIRPFETGKISPAKPAPIGEGQTPDNVVIEVTQ